jgi:hypothetical protein
MLPLTIRVTEIVDGDAVCVAQKYYVTGIPDPLEHARRAGPGNEQKLLQRLDIGLQLPPRQNSRLASRRWIDVVFGEAALP